VIRISDQRVGTNSFAGFQVRYLDASIAIPNVVAVRAYAGYKAEMPNGVGVWVHEVSEWVVFNAHHRTYSKVIHRFAPMISMSLKSIGQSRGQTSFLGGSAVKAVSTVRSADRNKAWSPRMVSNARCTSLSSSLVNDITWFSFMD
tara:strand:- start:974 stop:1408 length:435 start_codon:yes stop_codon:yes gene_type:complete